MYKGFLVEMPACLADEVPCADASYDVLSSAMAGATCKMGCCLRRILLYDVARHTCKLLINVAIIDIYKYMTMAPIGQCS